MHRYFKDPVNYLDWLDTCSILFFLLSDGVKQSKDPIKIFYIFILIILFYRSFNYLAIFSNFTIVVKMINNIIVKIYPFFTAIAIFYLTAVFIFIYIDPHKEVWKNFREGYYWIMFGNVEADSFETPLFTIPILFGTLMIGIFLLNLLIAYMSNEFSRMESQQVIDIWREKARLNCQLELVILGFKNVFRSNPFRKFGERDHIYNNMRINRSWASLTTADTYKSKIRQFGALDEIQV